MISALAALSSCASPQLVSMNALCSGMCSTAVSTMFSSAAQLAEHRASSFRNPGVGLGHGVLKTACSSHSHTCLSSDDIVPPFLQMHHNESVDTTYRSCGAPPVQYTPPETSWPSPQSVQMSDAHSFLQLAPPLEPYAYIPAASITAHPPTRPALDESLDPGLLQLLHGSIYSLTCMSDVTNYSREILHALPPVNLPSASIGMCPAGSFKGDSNNENAPPVCITDAGACLHEAALIHHDMEVKSPEYTNSLAATKLAQDMCPSTANQPDAPFGSLGLSVLPVVRSIQHAPMHPCAFLSL